MLSLDDTLVSQPGLEPLTPEYKPDTLPLQPIYSIKVEEQNMVSGTNNAYK
jgi:hypothetical protein